MTRDDDAVRRGCTGICAWGLGTLLLLVGCGGGDTDSEDARAAPAGRSADAAQVSPTSPAAEFDLAVIAVTRLGETRVGRTVFDYTFTVTVRNQSDSQYYRDVVATLTTVGQGSSIRQDRVGFSRLFAGESVASAGTVTIRHDRRVPFDLAAMVWHVVGVSSPPTLPTHPLNDTGVTASQCYRAGSDELVHCGSPEARALSRQQDGMIGRDVTHRDSGDGKLGFSFSEVPTPGAGTYARTECVKDEVTGLTWEGKTNDGGPRDGGRFYTNRGDGRQLDASGYMAAVNASRLCGYDDWRLPTVQELQSLVVYGVSLRRPMIDQSWFPNAGAGTRWYYWSSSRWAGVYGSAWLVDFEIGGTFFHSVDLLGQVRLVR